jgi:hypothetical protein
MSEAERIIGDLLAEIVGNIETMRQNEGNSVTIVCDNPEAESSDRQAAVDVCGDFTGFQEIRFYGTTWPDALRGAADSARVYYAKEDAGE